MREIKFRAWDTFNKKWLDQKLFSISCCNGELLNKSCGGYIGGVEIQQFTGLKDKNGKDIYEGDIVKYRSMDNIPWRFGTIKIIGGGKTATALETKIDTTDGYLYPLSNEREFPVTKSEVVGNIFENPKLLSK